MKDIVVYGIPGSPYLRSALLGLHEKGASYRLAVLGQGVGGSRTEDHLQRHPFGRIPVLELGDFRLYETQAILRYLDAWLKRMQARPSMQATEVDRLKQAA